MGEEEGEEGWNGTSLLERRLPLWLADCVRMLLGREWIVL